MSKLRKSQQKRQNTRLQMRVVGELRDMARRICGLSWPAEAKPVKQFASVIDPDAFCGVYLLCEGNSVRYVGKTASAFARIASHRNNTHRIFDRIVFVPCPHEGLDVLEEVFIGFFDPPENTLLKGGEFSADDVVRLASIAYDASGAKKRAAIL